MAGSTELHSLPLSNHTPGNAWNTCPPRRTLTVNPTATNPNPKRCRCNTVAQDLRFSQFDHELRQKAGNFTRVLSHDLVFLATTHEFSAWRLKAALKVSAINPCNVVQLFLFDQSQTTCFRPYTIIWYARLENLVDYEAGNSTFEQGTVHSTRLHNVNNCVYQKHDSYWG